MASDGFSTHEPAYKAAQKIAGQTPRVPKWKIGRRANAFSQKVRLTPTANTVGLVHTVSILDPSGVSTTCSNTVVTGETIAAICGALANSITAITDMTATNNSTYVECSADNDGEYFFFNSPNDELEFNDVTADPGIAADLAAIELADPNYYGICLDSNSANEIAAAQAYIETLEKIAGYHTCDAEVRDSGVSDDIISVLQAASMVRCFVISSKDHDGFAGAAILGRMFTNNPGRATWAFKTLTGVTVDTLTATQSSTILGKGGNIYTTIAGYNIIENGRAPDGTYLDIVRGRDWLMARLRERVIALFVNNLKVPYTDAGIAMVVSLIRAQLREGQSPAFGFISDNPDFVVTYPDVLDVSANDKANRILPNISFEATLQGAIQAVVPITGVISV
jgi:hypothetical protein